LSDQNSLHCELIFPFEDFSSTYYPHPYGMKDSLVPLPAI